MKGSIEAMSGVKRNEKEAKGESSPPRGAGATGTLGLGKRCASSCPLPVQLGDLLVPSHGVQTLPRAGEPGRRVLGAAAAAALGCLSPLNGISKGMARLAGLAILWSGA